MNRIVHQLGTRRERGTGALLPYFTAGFPDAPTFQELLRSADRAGAAVAEVGFPYSDSIADGSVIQESFHAVLERRFRASDVFSLVGEVRPTVACGLVAMVSCTLLYRLGIAAFVERAKGAGFDGIIVPDAPVEESVLIREAARGSDVCYVGLVAPTSSPARAREIAHSSTGFVYRIARAGTTGERSELPPDLGRDVAGLRACTELPICVGFGVSTPEHVRSVCRVSDGAIVGSAIVRRIRDAVQAEHPPDRIVELVGAYLADLAATTRG